MAENSGFFDARLVDGEYDRVYLAESFAKYFASFIGNGIFGEKSNELIVKQKETAAMSVRVLSGQAWINGYWYENTDELSLAIDVADGVLNRIDVIALRWYKTERVIRLAVIKGTPASNPSVPNIVRSEDYYDLKLAEVYVRAGTTSITQANITDTRLNAAACGLVQGVVQQFDTTEFGAQLEAYISEFISEKDSWFAQFKSDSKAEFDNLVAELEETLSTSDVATLNKKIADTAAAVVELESDVAAMETNVAANKASITGLRTDVNTLKALFTESGPNPGCYYRIVNGVNEWVNPPMQTGIEYRTTERWKGKPVYQRVFYVAALPHTSVLAIKSGVTWDEVISIAGYAIDSTMTKRYSFPVYIESSTVPNAVITYVDKDGTIFVQTSSDMRAFQTYIILKYVK